MGSVNSHSLKRVHQLPVSKSPEAKVAVAPTWKRTLLAAPSCTTSYIYNIWHLPFPPPPPILSPLLFLCLIVGTQCHICKGSAFAPTAPPSPTTQIRPPHPGHREPPMESLAGKGGGGARACAGLICAAAVLVCGSRAGVCRRTLPSRARMGRGSGRLLGHRASAARARARARPLPRPTPAGNVARVRRGACLGRETAVTVDRYSRGLDRRRWWDSGDTGGPPAPAEAGCRLAGCIVPRMMTASRAQPPASRRRAPIFCRAHPPLSPPLSSPRCLSHSCSTYQPASVRLCLPACLPG